LIKVGVVPVFFIIDVFYSCWHLIKLGYKFYENYKTHVYINNLSDYVMSPEEEEQPGQEMICNICLDVIQMGKKLACGHVFHLRCIKEWVTSNSGCPLCKHPIASEARPVNRQFGDGIEGIDGSINQSTGFKKDQGYTPKNNSEFNRYKAYKEILQLKSALERSDLPNNLRNMNIDTGSLSYSLPTAALYNRSLEVLIFLNT
jgi:hypothetical protein